jgi:hypothetical protein
MIESLPFFRTHEYVAAYLAVTYVLSLSFLVFGRGHQEIFNSLLCFGLLLMGWTVIPSIIAADNYWFVNTPPSFVSRFALVSIISFVFFDLVKARFVPSNIFYFGASSIIVMLLLTFFLGFLYINDFDSRTWMAFTLILGASSLTAFYLVFRFMYLDLHEWVRPSVILILLFFTIAVGFSEIANNPFVYNLFRGSPEARSASLFHNPNWFAVYISPLLFYSAYLAVCDAQKYAAVRSFLIVALVTLGLILSGSRSVTTVAAIFVFSMLAVSIFMGYREALHRLLLVFLPGGAAGVALGYFISLLLGGVVIERYSLLIDRLFFWPLYYFDDVSAQQSLHGRFIIDSYKFVDNAYLFALHGNPLIFFAILLILFITVFRLVHSVYSRASFPCIVGNFLLVYVMAIGAVGQVFWAFPVWISICLFFAIGVLLSKHGSFMGTSASSHL